MNQHLLIMQLVGIKQIRLVEYQHDRHPVSLSRCKEAIDKGCTGLRTVHGDNEHRLVYIGRNDMTLLREVDAFADDVVATILYLGDIER